MTSGRWRDESGVSLAEVVVALAIMGLAVVALVAGVGSAALLSHHQEAGALAAQWAANLAESVKRAPYVPCAAPGDYAVGLDAPPGVSVEVRAVEFYRRDANDFASACPPDPGLQRVRLLVVAHGGRGERRLDVVKRLAS